MLIGPVEGLTPIDFVLLRSRVKDTRVTFIKMVSDYFLDNYLSRSFHM